MGHFFTRDSLLNEQTYILGFSSKFGTAGRITNPKTYNVVPPVRNSFETWIHNVMPHCRTTVLTSTFVLKNGQENTPKPTHHPTSGRLKFESILKGRIVKKT